MILDKIYMPHINSTEFGSITIDSKKYGQVVIVGDKVVEREYDRLKKLFGTSHKIGDWELEELLKDKPEIIVIGTGQSGALVVDKEIIDAIKREGIELIIEETPQATMIYNDRVTEGKKINALIHTTC
jgi:hypothetical protein